MITYKDNTSFDENEIKTIGSDVKINAGFGSALKRYNNIDDYTTYFIVFKLKDDSIIKWTFDNEVEMLNVKREVEDKLNIIRI